MMKRLRVALGWDQPGMAELDALITSVTDQQAREALERNKAKLLKERLTSKSRLHRATEQKLHEIIGIPYGDVLDIKAAFPDAGGVPLGGSVGHQAGAEGGAPGPPLLLPSDTSHKYLRQLLQPDLTQLPSFDDLKDIIQRPLTAKLPAITSDYLAAQAQYPGFEQVLIPVLQVPTLTLLATRVSHVLQGKLRNVKGKGMLHCDVDLLFDKMFDLASEAGLLVYHAERTTAGNMILSSTTERPARPDYQLWVRDALLFIGEETATAGALDDAVSDLQLKMAGTNWDSNMTGTAGDSNVDDGICPYTIGYAVGGPQLKLLAIREGHILTLLEVDMGTMAGKLQALVAVINVIRLLRVMAQGV